MSSPIQLLDLSQARVRGSEGAGTTTLTIDDFHHQIFNLSGNRTVVLPTTGVKKGMKWYFENSTSSELTIQASGGQALTVANSTNMDATIREGFCQVVALVDTPTTAAHWRVSSVQEVFEINLNGSGQFTGGVLRFTRSNRNVNVQNISNITHSSSANPQTASGSIFPTRIYPPGINRAATVNNAETSYIQLAYFASDFGLALVYRNYSGTLTAFTSISYFAMAWTSR